MPTIAVWSGAPPADQLRSLVSFQQLGFSTEREAADILLTRKVDGILVPIGVESLRAMEVLLQMSAAGLIRCPVIVDVPGEAVAFDQIVEIILARIDLRLAIRAFGAGALDREIAKLPKAPIPAAVDYVLSKLAPTLHPATRQVLIPAIVIGGKRANSAVFESASALHGREIRKRLQRFDLPSPSKVLGLVAGTCVAYLTQFCGMSLRQVAQVCSFDSEDSMRRYLNARTRIAPTEWKRMGVAESLLLTQDRIVPR